MYDLIIIGSGPAGMAAAIYAARKRLKTLIISKDIGGQALYSNAVENYLGFSLIKGVDLVKRFQEHLDDFLDILSQKITTNGVDCIVRTHNKHFPLQIKYLEKDRWHHASSKTIIIANGKVPRQLNVPGELELQHKGVTYCSWCDGPYFKNKDVIVVGGGNSALDAVLNISRVVNSITVINNLDSLTGDQIMVDKVLGLKNTKVLNKTEVVTIEGVSRVRSVIVKDLETKDQKRLPTEGVFLEIGYIPATDIYKNLILLNKNREIVIDENNMTNVPGVFAAGDITNVNEKQIIVACGEGAKAAISAGRYLARY